MSILSTVLSRLRNLFWKPAPSATPTPQEEARASEFYANHGWHPLLLDSCGPPKPPQVILQPPAISPPQSKVTEFRYPGLYEHYLSSKWESAGGVVLAGLSPEKIRRVYLIKPSNGYGPVAFPKGRVDDGGNVEETAIREVKEETGLDAVILPNSKLGRFEGSMSWTTYFLMVARGGKTSEHDWETEAVLELDIDEAIALFEKISNYRDLEVAKKAKELISYLCSKLNYTT